MTSFELNEGLVSLDDTWCWTDVWAFQRWLASAEQGGEDRLFDLYRGRFLEGDPAPWAVPLRERIHRS